MNGQLSMMTETSDAYEQFVDKFKVKKTTDECYTPQHIYDAVAEYVSDTYKIARENMCRPFWPGANYASYNYDGKIVVDNPPFSCMTEIIRFYCDKGIPFFLFAPALVFHSHDPRKTEIVTSVDITYANGAVVNTNFVTSLENEYALRTDPTLRSKILEAQKQGEKRQLPKYTYNDNVITIAKAQRYVERGVKFNVKKKECVYIRSLDEQKASGKTIFGSGLLVGSAAAAAADTTIEWELSEREKEIVRLLDNNAGV